ncbi:hypothetical protein ABZ883_04695 [Streptomyces sp. NPDC046977]|uniref:hypothetical protein n=1 Tax=Streptomyces sp. NPDC046977 TaxID=3154703 RepID=UPI0033C2CA7B
MADNPDDLPPRELLRQAIEKLRGRLDALDDCRGPWRIVNEDQRPYPQTISNIGVPYVVANTHTDPSHPPDIAQYICLMHPGVGRGVLAWLESWTGIDLREDAALPEDARHAIAVAGLLLKAR